MMNDNKLTKPPEVGITPIATQRSASLRRSKMPTTVLAQVGLTSEKKYNVFNMLQMAFCVPHIENKRGIKWNKNRRADVFGTSACRRIGEKKRSNMINVMTKDKREPDMKGKGLIEFGPGRNGFRHIETKGRLESPKNV